MFQLGEKNRRSFFFFRRDFLLRVSRRKFLYAKEVRDHKCIVGLAYLCGDGLTRETFFFFFFVIPGRGSLSNVEVAAPYL